MKNGKINTFEIYFDSAPFPKYYYQAMQIEKKYFLLKLLPPRPTFFSDITDDERNIMNEHGKYWRNLMEQGIVHVFGPVLDPKGVWGLGIVEAINQDDIRSFTANDPAIKSGLTTLEIYPIQAVLRK